MNHTSLDGFKQQRLSFGIRPSGPNAGVDCLGHVKFVWLLQKDENVHMWKSMLLEFDGVYVGDCGAKDPMFVDELDNGLFFYLKDPQN